jgi:hypothetical protein
MRSILDRARVDVSFDQPAGEENMKLEPFLKISLLLGVLWAGSFLLFHVASVLIHMLLVVAVLFYVGHLVREGSTT